jgi:hypothetical protein
VRTTFLILAFAAFALRTLASEFTRWSDFDSVAAFVSSARAFKPATTKSDLAALFTVRDGGQPEDPKTSTPISAVSVERCDVLWSREASAVVFATANPPTQATKSAVGILFLLCRVHDRWQIAQYVQFTASGKYAEVTATVTGDSATGGPQPYFTVTESQGGRGYSYQLSGTYTVDGPRLKRIELE